MKRSKLTALIAPFLLLACALFAQQTPAGQTPPPATAGQSEPPAGPAYTPKFKGDPARSDSEAAALAYMRVVIRAQNQFNRQYDHYATSLPELVHSGSFTKRMAHDTQRGDYTIHYRAKKDSYQLSAIPQQYAPDHRAFFANEDGKIRVEDSKPAGPDSPILK